MNLVILTDSSCDLPIEYLNENNIPALGLVYHFKGKDYVDDFGQTINYKDFYDAVRNGELPTTSQVNAFRFEEEFTKHVKEDKAIIYIAFSSALSGTYNSSLIAKEAVLEKYPKADITIIDSKCASSGVGLLVYYANEMRRNGASKEEIISWVNDNLIKTNHYFTVNDLNHLKRGGRVSSTSAIIGTILDIKPILYVNSEGKLISINKVKGRKKSIKTLVDYFRTNVINPEEQVVFISHGDCLNDAEHLKKLLCDEFKIKDVIISSVGPCIGSHGGPDILTLFFLGKERTL
ncbi:DegV family protein [Clostridium hydrogeniformans]|uniref:DegV family protein n=1 Tax=Clostridium hydrogeniformans TaxID=349933 RepID=UPI00048208F2|nr:DegV family protein [Clostridium hydrogeniformans]